MTGDDITGPMTPTALPHLAEDGSAAFARGKQYAGLLPPLDHAAIRHHLVGIMLAMFLSALEQTIVAPALPAIGKVLADLGGDGLSPRRPAATPSSASMPAHHHAGSDRDFHRWFDRVRRGADNLGAGFRPRLAGLGGGGLLPIAQKTIIADILRHERPMVQSYTAVVFLSASILGPVLGGLLTDHLHWSFIPDQCAARRDCPGDDRAGVAPFAASR